MYLFDEIQINKTTESMEMDQILLKGYEETPIVIQERKTVDNEAYFSFIDGPRVTINGNRDSEYLVKFIDLDTKKEVFTSLIKNNHWTACSVKYEMNWAIEVYENNILWKSHKFDPTGKRVYIHIDSNSLGDTLAWFPYVEEYRKQKNCTVICSTHRNYFFEGKYPEIEFVKYELLSAKLVVLNPVILFRIFMQVLVLVGIIMIRGRWKNLEIHMISRDFHYNKQLPTF